MKIKDLPDTMPLDGVRFIYPADGKKYYWKSQWNKGVWASVKESDTRVKPLFVDDLKEVLEWEVVEEGGAE